MSRSRNPAAGFTLIELMIALSLGLILVLGLSTVFVSSKQGYRVQESSGRMQESLRYALEILGRDIRHADFWGGVDAALIEGGSLAPGDGCSPEWHRFISVGVQGLEGAADSPDEGCTVNGANYVPDSDVLALRFADPTSVFSDTPDLEGKSDLEKAIESEENVPVFVRISLGRDGQLIDATSESAADDLDEIPAGDGVFNYALQSVAYSLGYEDREQGGATIQVPTLYACRIDSPGSLPFNCPSAAVEGIEQMQFAYGVDVDNDRVADRFLPASSLAAADWPRVMSVRVGLIVRGDALDEFTDTNTYQMPGGYTYTPPADARRYQRRAIIKDFQIRNRSRG